MELREQIAVLTGGVRLARMLLEENRMARAPGLMRLSNLAGSLKESDALANDLAERLSTSVGSLNAEMGTTRTIIETIESTRDALRAINQAVLPGDNGAPPLDSAPSPALAVGSRPSETAGIPAVKPG